MITGTLTEHSNNLLSCLTQIGVIPERINEQAKTFRIGEHCYELECIRDGIALSNILLGKEYKFKDRRSNIESAQGVALRVFLEHYEEKNAHIVQNDSTYYAVSEDCTYTVDAIAEYPTLLIKAFVNCGGTVLREHRIISFEEVAVDNTLMQFITHAKEKAKEKYRVFAVLIPFLEKQGFSCQWKEDSSLQVQGVGAELTYEGNEIKVSLLGTGTVSTKSDVIDNHAKFLRVINGLSVEKLMSTKHEKLEQGQMEVCSVELELD